MSKFTIVGHASMFLANASWGLMSPVAKIVMSGGIVAPLILTDMRVFGAMVLFWVVSFFRKPERVAPRDMVKLFGASLLAIVFNQGCFIFGVGLTSPGDASIITTSMPLWAMILAAFFLKEPITGKKVTGIALGATGALLLILGSNQGTTSGNNSIWGDLLVLLAQLSYALYIVLFKNFVTRYSLITIMKWMFTYAFICILPFSYDDLIVTNWNGLDLQAIGAICFIVVCGTFVSYMLIVVGQKRLRPTVAGMYNYIQPLVACIVSVYLGMDSFNFVKGIAIVLIFGGVYLVTVSKSRADMVV
ncbi:MULTISPECIES: DMT family transporter [Bacteroidales]|uniref:Membrane protein n=1 Tax=Coprobacter secundus subsp. similis TaxID=2751153 RepID=A0A7G1HQJ0_9BACT|nr:MULTISPECIES: DMT family transporter [Bacteroidales]BCI61700.1 membrane protein [Coprobacter secundus subsp. similis]